MKKKLKTRAFIQSLCAGLALCIIGTTPVAAGVFNLQVYDTTNAIYYSVGYNWDASIYLWGDRVTPNNKWVDAIAPKYLGNDFITVAGDSKRFTGDTLMTFDLDLAATVCLTPQYDNQGTPPPVPTWISSAYTLTSDTLWYNDDQWGDGKCQIWKKDFAAGSHVVLRNQNDTNHANYGVLIKPKAIDSLVVYDTQRASYFTLQSDIDTGKCFHPDNGSTIGTIDPSFVDNQDCFITTANDSKYYTGDTLMTFKMGLTGYVFLAFREFTPLPSWLDDSWKFDSYVGQVITSAGTPHNVYRKWFAAGSKVVLGNNGSTSLSNYFVIIHREAPPLPGTNDDFTIASTKDAWVRDGSYANNNYGSETYLYVKKASSGYNRKAILEINVAELNEPVQSANLVLTEAEWCASCTTDASITVQKTDTNWDESTITWNNFPATTEMVIEQLVVEGVGVDVWYLDITRVVNDEIMNGDKVFSLVISSNTTNAELQWRSVDATYGKPNVELSR